MAFRFNVFTSNFDIVEGQSPFWLNPVPTREDLPAVAPNGAAANVLDEDSIFVFDLEDGEWHNTRISLALYSDTINSEGVSVDSELTDRFNDYRVNVHPASSTTPGVVNNDSQNFSGDKTFDNNVNVSENLNVTGDSNVIGNSVVQGTMNVQGDTDLDSNLNVDGNSVVVGNSSVGLDLTVSGNSQVNGNSDVDGNLTVDGDTVVQGNLTVNGTTTTINTQTLDVEDHNITINNNGNDVSAEGAGLTVERVGVDGSLIYDDSTASKFKIGSVGSEVEIADISSVQGISNKNIDADQNTIINIEDENIKVGAAISAEKIHDGTVDNVEFGHLDGVTAPIQDQLDNKIDGPATAIDNAIVRYDGTTGKLAQDSLVIINDLGEISGVTRLDVDDISLDSNAITTPADLVLNPVGNIDANTNTIVNVVDPVNDQDAATKAYVDIFREPGDLPQIDFNIADNQASLVDVTDIVFSNSVTRSAEIHYSIEILATNSLYETGKLHLIQKGSEWDISHSASGDNSQILFDITPDGQVQYRSALYAGFVSGILKIRAITTSI